MANYRRVVIYLSRQIYGESHLIEMEALFKALGDATRLRILGLLLTGEVCVCDIHESLRIPQPKASRHLAYLRRAGLVETRRDGLWIHYRLGKLAGSGAGRRRGRGAPRADARRRSPARCGAPAEADRVLRADAGRRGRGAVLLDAGTGCGAVTLTLPADRCCARQPGRWAAGST